MLRNSLSTLEEVSQYRLQNPSTSLLIDTSILGLLLVGTYDLAYLKECPLMTENGKCYDEQHFRLLKEIISRFPQRMVITPHVLAEINMLRKRINPPRFGAYFTEVIAQLRTCKEKQVDLEVLLKNGGLLKFGFTDISLIEAAREEGWPILMDDINLYRAYTENLDIIYFSKLVVNDMYKVTL